MRRSGRKTGRPPTPRRPRVPTRVVMPADLAPELRPAWQRLAPVAVAARTLTPATVPAFVDLVLVPRDLAHWALGRLIAEGLVMQSGQAAGPQAHPLLREYRSLVARLSAGYRQFRLAPTGDGGASVRDSRP